MTAPTIAQLLDRARSRHWAFNDVQMPDGAVVQMMNDRQRAVLLDVIAEVEPLLGETVDVATSLVGGQLVALDDAGVPYFATTTDTGYPIAFDGAGVPYLDTAHPVTTDPFGAAGSTPGFPLPADLLRIIALAAITDLDPTRARTIELLDQKAATRSGAGHGSIGGSLRAFISANRVVPVRVSSSVPSGSPLIDDLWSHVTTLRLAVVLCPTLASTADVITLPLPLIDVLVAEIAEFLATASRGCTEADKRRFETQRTTAKDTLLASAAKIVSAVTVSQVIYRR